MIATGIGPISGNLHMINSCHILWMVAKSESPVENGGKHPIIYRVSTTPLVVQDFATTLYVFILWNPMPCFWRGTWYEFVILQFFFLNSNMLKKGLQFHACSPCIVAVLVSGPLGKHHEKFAEFSSRTLQSPKLILPGARMGGRQSWDLPVALSAMQNFSWKDLEIDDGNTGYSSWKMTAPLDWDCDWWNQSRTGLISPNFTIGGFAKKPTELMYGGCRKAAIPGLRIGRRRFWYLQASWCCEWCDRPLWRMRSYGLGSAPYQQNSRNLWPFLLGGSDLHNLGRLGNTGVRLQAYLLSTWLLRGPGCPRRVKKCRWLQRFCQSMPPTWPCSPAQLGVVARDPSWLLKPSWCAWLLAQAIGRNMAK